EKNTPRWMIFLIDCFIVLGSVMLAYMLRFNFDIPEDETRRLYTTLIVVLVVRMVSFIIAKTYAGIIRYTSTGDAVRIFIVIFSGSILFSLANIVTYSINEAFLIPFSIIIIEFLSSTLAMIVFRLIVKIAFLELQTPPKGSANVVIFGAGDAGITAKRVLDRDAGTKFKVLAFFDDNPNKAGKKLEGVPVLSPDKMQEMLQNQSVSHVILAVMELDPKRKAEIIEICLANNTKVLNVPPVIKWINGELSFRQIRKINIEDLLEREIIRLDEKMISRDINGKTIFITGACGSIGSEIVRQVAMFTPSRIILIDQAETPMHQMELECLEKYPDLALSYIIADITLKERLATLFSEFHPEIVYHAAAYKHVPMMEMNPLEAVRNNVLGTQILADLSVEFKVHKFIFISTDKAVNPTNVMGATKRIAEIYIQSLNKLKTTQFITTRFGNVLGSNGSAIPLFQRQIERGGPVTITHPEVTRYFMTIPEACQLVLEAGAMGNGGEIFMFDMGESVKIVDLVKKMISLSGLTLGKDIQIKFTGLRPGEKLYEELLTAGENYIPTHHPRILIAKVMQYDLDAITADLKDLIGKAAAADPFSVVRKMKSMAPEYKSQNSIYQQLDTIP
ncbi:MAG: polysaccharide biosynthesis protein, partial [Bacteroidetes bacterium]|nr:polysaccharide biosynthesis protein [Bacteroidota bacterium]